MKRTNAHEDNLEFEPLKGVLSQDSACCHITFIYAGTRNQQESLTMSHVLVSLFKYKAWANAELHAALTQFDEQLHPSEFRAMLDLLDHANVVDRIFKGHLIGATTPAFKATHSDPVPSLPELIEVVRSTDDWYVQFASNISAERLKHRVFFSFTDGDSGTMSCEEMLFHVITHSGYHRGSIGQILESLGIDSPPDSLTKFLHRHEPERRFGTKSDAEHP